MTMIAIVQQQGAVVPDCEVAVFDSSGECRASSFSTPADNHRVYLTIQGEGGGEPLTFRVVYQGTEGTIDVAAAETYTYNSDAMAGTLSTPFVLTIPTETTGLHKISSTTVNVCSTQGGLELKATQASDVRICSSSGRVYIIHVTNRETVSLPAGIYIVNNKKYVVK
ncbi:MAG: hypothetical protein IKU63_00200 [Bacteroidaceae bacterium]|nr:hypothetical protein [Bacteroidaceae bacterium]